MDGDEGIGRGVGLQPTGDGYHFSFDETYIGGVSACAYDPEDEEEDKGCYGHSSAKGAGDSLAGVQAQQAQGAPASKDDEDRDGWDEVAAMLVVFGQAPGVEGEGGGPPDKGQGCLHSFLSDRSVDGKSKAGQQ